MKKTPPTLSRFALFLAVPLLTLLLGPPPAHASPPWVAAAGDPILEPGIATVSCAAQQRDGNGTPLLPSESFSVGVFDLRNPDPSDYAPLSASMPIWNPPMWHHDSWSVENIGNVFGIALDAEGNMYVAAHGLYDPYWGPPSFGFPYLQNGALGLAGGATEAQASGTIYKLDAISGVATIFARLPQQADPHIPWNPEAGPGIGNIAYDREHDQFFATNLEDGVIYRIDNSGTIAGSFDPNDTADGLADDDGAPGMPAFGDRVWGIAVANGGVYYAVWRKGNAADPNLIRRIGLDASGAMLPSTDDTILVVPPSPGANSYNTSTPVSDLAFSADGSTMVIAERGMIIKYGTDYYTTLNHRAPVKLARPGIAGWTVTNQVAPGNNTINGESYGGVDYGHEDGDPEGLIWMGSADMATGRGPHGIQGLRPEDMPATLMKAPASYVVPYDPSYTASGPDVKSVGGDVEILRGRPATGCIAEITAVECPQERGDPYRAKLSVTNLTGQVAHYLLLNPCPSDDLPPGAVTLQPQPAFTVLSPPLVPGASEGVEITIPGSSNQKVCFLVTLLDATGGACCTRKVCVKLPPCDCVELLDHKIDCELLPDGRAKYTISLTVANRTALADITHEFAHVTLLPSPNLLPGLDPALVENLTLTPPSIPPGGTGTVKFCYFGSAGRIYTNVVFHDESLENCCVLEDLCLKLPDCGAGDPDTCRVTQLVPCRPVAGELGGGVGTIVFTICNNGTVSRTYRWSAEGLVSPVCDQVLDPSDFSPSSGVVGPVPPGACASVVINVRCREFAPGDCADFIICASAISPAAGERLCCRGRIYRPRIIIDPVPIDPVEPIPVFPVDEWVRLAYTVESTDDIATEVVLSITDGSGALEYAAAPGERGDLLYTTDPIRLAPGVSEEVVFFARRVDGGTESASFFDIIVAVGPTGDPESGFIGSITPGVLAADAVVEIGLLRAVEAITLIAEPPRIALAIPTERGAHYQIQESAQLTTPSWIDVPCETSAANSLPDGSFIGDGTSMTVYLPCDFSRGSMFYRVALKR